MMTGTTKVSDPSVLEDINISRISQNYIDTSFDMETEDHSDQISLSKTLQDFHIEILPNSKKLLYENAINLLKEMCQNLPLEEITSIKFHTNSWGMGSNNLMADQFVPRMKRLTSIDMSDTIKYSHRSDLSMGIRAWLKSVEENKLNLQALNLAHNQLNGDGLRCCHECLSVNSTLKVLNVSNCQLEDKSCLMLLDGF
jgi:hypothetical protein